MGHFVTSSASLGFAGRAMKTAAMGLMILALAACGGFNLFSAPKIKEEEIIPPDQLYSEALVQMDNQRFAGAVTTLEKLERQHPYSDQAERAKLMIVYGNFRLGKFDETILAADRFLAIYPDSKEVAYVLYLKGTSYFNQIKDITRDQQISRDAIDTYTLVINNYPESEYAADAREKMGIAFDQLAGKEMSVGRYYLGNGQYAAAINRFRVVVENYQTSTHIEEALYRLTEANLSLGLINEAQTAAAVLGHNYPSSTWYQSAYALLQKQGLAPQVNQGSPLAGLFRRT
jgi:outer membrane protein assembly factor BamD